MKSAHYDLGRLLRVPQRYALQENVPRKRFACYYNVFETK